MNVDRSRFNDTEWALYLKGECSYQTAYGMPWIEYCRARLDRRNPWGYCAQHAKEIVEDYGWRA